MTESLRVAIVEDSTLLREGLVRLLAEAGFETVAARPDATDLDETITAAQPDVVVLDVRLPPTHRDEGVRAAIRVRATHPQVAVLLLSQYVETTYARELLAAGSRGIGYLLKDRVTDLEQLRRAIEDVAAGGTVLDPQMVEEMLRARADPLARLTPRETQVLRAMAEGRSNAAIARELVVSPGAVEKHVTSIFGKLGLEESAAAHRRVLAVLQFLGA
ncbi:response regulator transcription factor [Amnibacterium sp. CER49]|uniref:response regulator transcription factor n=1 Tax=Amnibacterium sp. CER49 TaxID=3039161 RepID=UPI002449CD12|nr:response regulator transcription factor [Amnibacterium sp. CER49]MDH2445524.1 response regulator transcription factor [Amnibacterium sp. CER49]